MGDELISLSIPLFHAKEQEGLRLLELPPEILAALESTSPPSLSVKSAPPPEASANRTASGHAEAYHAVICTADQTYQLKQVQTSNSIFILQPYLQGTSSPDTGLCAFATCSSTLETSLLKSLDPVKQRSALEWLEYILPLYDLEIGIIGAHKEGNGSKEEVFQNVPYSQSECEHAWTQLLAFESSHGSSFRPLATTALEVWKFILDIYEANSDRPASEQANLMRSEAARELDCEQGLVDAILSRVLAASSTEDRSPFDKDNTIELIGTLLLQISDSSATRLNEHETSGGVDAEDAFEEKLQSAVPDAWWSYICAEHIARLKQSHEERQKRVAARAQALAKESEALTAANTGAKRTLPPGKRNWHERFKRNKK